MTCTCGRPTGLRAKTCAICRNEKRSKTRRLAMIKVCAICASSFHPKHKQQRTCSLGCGGLLRVRLHPEVYSTMSKAHAATAKKRAEQLEQAVAGLTPVEAFLKGRKQGVATTHQKWMRRTRMAS